jgi:hypothetical protein
VRTLLLLSPIVLVAALASSRGGEGEKSGGKYAKPDRYDKIMYLASKEVGKNLKEMGLSANDIPSGVVIVKDLYIGEEAKKYEELSAKQLVKYSLGLGAIRVSSEPPGAAIEIDGVLYEERTVRTLPATPGQHTIRLLKEGFQTAEGTVTVARRKVAEFSKKLQRGFGQRGRVFEEDVRPAGKDK